MRYEDVFVGVLRGCVCRCVRGRLKNESMDNLLIVYEPVG